MIRSVFLSSRVVHQMFSSKVATVVLSLHRLVEFLLPLGAPTNHRAVLSALGPSWFGFRFGPGHGPGGETAASAAMASVEVDAVPGHAGHGGGPMLRS